MSSPPAEPRVLTVKAQEGQYHIEGTTEKQDPHPPNSDGLTLGEAGWMAVLTGTQWGPVTVHLHYLSQPPRDISPGWEMVVERDIMNEGEGLEITTLFQGSAGGLRLPSGRYRVRVHARDRAVAAPHNHLETPLERHLLEIWPSDEPQDPVLLVGPDEIAERR